jgi:ribose-phosphate pyrophosphokinase
MSDPNGELRVFSGRSTARLTEEVCRILDCDVGAARITTFPDGEIIVKIDEDVRGRDVYVIISTCEPVNDNLAELLIYVDCLKRASAGRITLVIPYFGYARQDRKDEGRVPITAKLVANLITAAGADRVVALDLHAAQIQGFFDLPVDHLSATPVFVDYFRELQARGELADLCLVSPDVGNVKVSEGLAKRLDGSLAIIYKRRLSGSQVETGQLIGSVRGKTVLMFDDIISTAGTVCEAARVVMDAGAKDVIAAATHPVLVGPAVERLVASPISKVVVCNTIPLPPRVDPLRPKLVELSIGPLLGQAIHRIHNNESVSALFKNTAGPKR